MNVDIVELTPNDELDVQRIKKALKKILSDYQVPQDLTCILTNDAQVHQLNRDYRNLDKPTDVLSFEMHDDIHPNTPLGEIYISLERAQEQALHVGHVLQKEVLLLSIHGTLHLLGYEHETEEGYQKMKNKENLYLSQFYP